MTEELEAHLGFTDMKFVPPDWPAAGTDRLVMLSLTQGVNGPLDIGYGPVSMVRRTFHQGTTPYNDTEGCTATDWTEAKILARVRAGMAPAHTRRLGHNWGQRPRTSLSLAAQGKFFLVLFLDRHLRAGCSFANTPFSARDDAIAAGRFTGARSVRNGRAAIMAVNVPELSTSPPQEAVPINFNINLLITGSYQTDHGEVTYETPVSIDPDIRWPDGTDVPGLPPPPA